MIRVHRLLKVVAALALWLAVPVTARSQYDLKLLKSDPTGRPMSVRDEGDNWNIPISVYSDQNVELYVSDILTLAGIVWDGSEFQKYGTYRTYLYSFYKNDHECRQHRIPVGHENDPKWLEACAELRYQRRLILVDMRKKTVTVQASILMQEDGQPHPELQSFQKITIPLNDTVNRPMFQAVTNITAMIKRKIGERPDTHR